MNQLGFLVRSGIAALATRGRGSKRQNHLVVGIHIHGHRATVDEFAKKQYSCYNRSIIPSLRSAGIVFKEADELDGDQKAFVEEYFKKVVFPDPKNPVIKNSFAISLSLHLLIYCIFKFFSAWNDG